MTDSAPPVDGEMFRRAIARWATGVSVVTAHENGHDAGLTVNALLSVSLRPPLLLISLTHDADTTPVIERTGRFAVNLLAATQRAVSERFAEAVPSDRKFGGLAVHRDPDGIPLIDGTLGAIRCAVERSIPLADHHLIVGRVVGVEAGAEGAPLLFYRSRYAEPLTPDTVRLGPAAP